MAAGSPDPPGRVSDRLPIPVQTSVLAIRERAARQGGPVVDLSIGAPTDPTPDVVRAALAAATDAPGYPLTVGVPALRRAVVDWYERAHGVTGLDVAQVLPVVGTKELIGSLALHLDVGAGDLIALPHLAYPTYAVGAALVRATAVPAETPAELDALPSVPRVVWANSPGNPTGRVLAPDDLRDLVGWCRAHGALLVSDECYLDLGYDVSPVSVLHPDVCGGRHDGVLAVQSLSKRSNLAGYRSGLVVGDAAVVAELTAVRRNLGLLVPGPVQAATVAALGDDEHVAVQRARYAARRAALRPALEAAGFRIDHGEAGLYLWATLGEPAATTVGRLADLGLVAVAGTEYGAAGAEHVRFALTVPDADVPLAVERLATWSTRR